MLGRIIAHYQVLEKLGEGGMGAVYKARDTHLDRFVALKVLPPERVADADRKRRFVQEAKAASALNHPNIITIHDIACADGCDFIVMEYVAGKTLDQLIGRKGLRLSEVLPYAIQIADALAKAHAAGIVHRDLKPSNIMVTGEGLVKVLDFGLAKLTEPAPPDESALTATAGLTGAPRTEEGTIIGTAAYMSPEQAEGRLVDARSDIFSFGSVLYEMLTGRRAFQGETKVSTLAAILHHEPKPASEIGAPLPREVERVLARCLRKDPQRRWQNMSDLKVALQDLKEESESGTLTATMVEPAGRSRRRRLLVPAAVLLLAAAGLWAWWLLRKPAPRELQIARLTFDAGAALDPIISPDGKLAAYASDRAGEGGFDIWVQQIAGRQPVRLTHHPANDWQPAFSPDGARIAFRSERAGGGIYMVDALGGEERRIADRGARPHFSPDGQWISYLEESTSRMYLVSASGGTPKAFQPEFSLMALPWSIGALWSPDGKYLLFDGVRKGDPKSRDWWVAPRDGGQATATGAWREMPPQNANQGPMAWVGRWVLFTKGSTIEGINLYRIPIHSGTWKISGAPEQLTSGAGIKNTVSVSADGRMLFPSFTWTTSIWTIGLRPDQGTTFGELQQLTRDTSGKSLGSLSRDGSKMAYMAWQAREKDPVEIRVRELAGTSDQVVLNAGVLADLYPRLSRDGSLLAYRNQVEDKWVAYVLPAGAASGREVCQGCAILDFFGDPRRAVIRYGARQVVRQSFGDGSRTALLEPKAGFVAGASLSPDDRWLAFVLGATDGGTRIYIAPVKDAPTPDPEWVLVADRGYPVSPAWSPDRRLLYYLAERDDFCCVWAQRLDASSNKPAGDPFSVRHLHRSNAQCTFGPKPLRSLAVGPDQMVLLLSEVTGHIWMSKLDVN